MSAITKHGRLKDYWINWTSIIVLLTQLPYSLEKGKSYKRNEVYYESQCIVYDT